MPEIGEIRRATSLGLKGTSSYIRTECKGCGVERWTQLSKGEARNKLCRACASRKRDKVKLICPVCGREFYVGHWYVEHGRKFCSNSCAGKAFRGTSNRNWKGGRAIRLGYIEVWLPRDDFFYPMTGKCNYVKEHRLIMAKWLGRCLQPWEIVHHKNGIKDDNRIENLELATHGSHSLTHSKGYDDGFKKGFTDGRNARLRQLKEEIRKLKEEVARCQSRATL